MSCRLKMLFTDVGNSPLQHFLARIEGAHDYLGHTALHWLVSNAMFEDWPDGAKETNNLYQVLRPFMNTCDLALGRIASKLESLSPFPFNENGIIEDCCILASMLSRYEEKTL